MALNIFELAARRKLRFSSTKGELSTEQLFDLPLESRDGGNLDAVAKAVNAELKSVAEESFVKTTSNPLKATLELKLEVVKFVIADKIEAAAKRSAASAKAAEKTALLEALANQEKAALGSLSAEQIKARLAVLEADAA